jgi:hypothetical protein
MARGRRDYEKAVVAVESIGYPDLHGRILMQDNFEDTPLKWGGIGSGNWFVTRQQRAAYNGSFGMELDITSDAPPAQRVAQAVRIVPIDVTERIMGEIFWRAEPTAQLDYFEMVLQRYTGAERKTAAVRYNAAAQYWEYLNDVPVWVQLQGSNQEIHGDAWNELTLSADCNTDHYITFKSNNIGLNMGGVAITTPGNLTAAHFEIWLSAYNITGTQLRVSIDDAVLKELEV